MQCAKAARPSVKVLAWVDPLRAPGHRTLVLDIGRPLLILPRLHHVDKLRYTNVRGVAGQAALVHNIFAQPRGVKEVLPMQMGDGQVHV